MKRLPIAISLLAASLLLAFQPDTAMAQACPVPALAQPSGGGTLARSAAKVRAGQPLRILAIGSSTTAGVGGGGAGFAHRLGPLLKAFRPQATFEVAVSGASGETAGGASARMAGEIARFQPDLVVWQLGTNDANFGVGEARFSGYLAAGLGAIRRAGADAVLIDPQFSRWAGDGATTGRIAGIIAAQGARAGAVVVRRYATMQRLAQTNRTTFDTLISWDGLHLTPSGHACLGEQVARTIARGIGGR